MLTIHRSLAPKARRVQVYDLWLPDRHVAGPERLGVQIAPHCDAVDGLVRSQLHRILAGQEGEVLVVYHVQQWELAVVGHGLFHHTWCIHDLWANETRVRINMQVDVGMITVGLFSLWSVLLFITAR